MGSNHDTKPVHGTDSFSYAACNLFKIAYIKNGCFDKAHFINCLTRRLNDIQ